MRKVALLVLLLVLIFGFVVVRQEHKLLSPVSGGVYLTALSKALDGVMPIEFSDRLVATVSGVTVIFPKTDKYDDLVRALQTVLNRATMEKRPVEIDLRFDKPVMRYGS